MAQLKDYGASPQGPQLNFCEDMLCTVLALPLRATAYASTIQTEYRYLQTASRSFHGQTGSCRSPTPCLIISLGKPC